MLPSLIRRRDLPTLWDVSDLDRFFNRSFGATGLWSPAADVRETDEGYLVNLELPGLTAEDVDVNVENGLLTVAGEKKEDSEREGEGWHVAERRYGKFSRAFSLPNSVDTTKVNAKFENGILRIELPKAAEAKPRKIKIS